MREVLGILLVEMDNTFSLLYFFLSGKKKKKETNPRDPLVHVYTHVLTYVYKQVAHMPVMHVFLLEIFVVDMLEKLGP